MSLVKFKTAFLASSLFFVATLTSLASHAYSYQTCNGRVWDWDGNTVNFQINTYSYPAGGSYNKAVRSAGQSWNDVASDFQLTFTDVYATSVTTGNGLNEIYYGNPSDLDGALGYAKRLGGSCGGWWSKDWAISEVDIVMSSDKTWRTYTHANVEDERNLKNGLNFEGTMLHELGHAMGLNHESRTVSIMAAGTYNSRSQGAVMLPFREDVRGFQFLNGSSGTKVDIAGMAYSFSSSDGSADALANITPLNSFATTYRVGGTISVTHGLENLGTQPITTPFKVKWYLSTNDYISIYDTPFPTYSTWSSLTSKGTHTSSNTIPNVPSGDYYIGYVIDPDNAITEFTKLNNRIAIGKITILN